MTFLDRRTFVAGAAAFSLLAALPVPAAFAQDSVAFYAPGKLGEMALGDANAPVKVVEYASMSCPHCAEFHSTAFEPFKAKYVDTGKVRFIFREFPLNAAAYPPAMVARCAPADQYFPILDAYFEKQQQWLAGPDVLKNIFDIAKGFGFSQQTFDACVTNQALYEGLQDSGSRGSGFGVTGTPTFFINARKLDDAPTLENLSKAVDALL